MLDALELSMSALDESVHAQRQLVADASHELRTPVTSLRTNIEILQQAGDMDAQERELLLDDVVEQIEELTLLMNDLIDLARGEEQNAEPEDVRLDMVVARSGRAHPAQLRVTDHAVADAPRAGARQRRRGPAAASRRQPDRQRRQVQPRGRARRGRAGSSSTITSIGDGGGVLTVRDHGHGISAEDMPHVFDRFYRGAEARGRPGSGWVLAIVRQVVSQHGGTVPAERAPGGGTLMRVTLPGAEPLDRDRELGRGAQASVPSGSPGLQAAAAGVERTLRDSAPGERP